MDLKARIAKIVEAVLKEAMPMLTLDPTVSEMKWILKALKEEFGLDSSAKIACPGQPSARTPGRCV